MNYSLTPLSKAFESISFKQGKTDYCLFAFILATMADDKIMPELLCQYEELHHLTSDYVLIISPSLWFPDIPNISGAEKISQILRTKKIS